MCGIFGIAVQQHAGVSRSEFETILEKLYLFSESRGKESAGLHIYLPDAREEWTVKGALPASELISSVEFKQYLSSALDYAYVGSNAAPERSIVAIGHSRLVTNGRAESQKNNQPVRWGDVTVIHNGIVVNVEKLWRDNPSLDRYAEVDTEILAAILASAMGEDFDPVRATQDVFLNIEGAASIAWMHSFADALILGSNTGDLYHTGLAQDCGFVFASERYILESATAGFAQIIGIKNLEAGSGLCMSLSASKPVRSFGLHEKTFIPGLEGVVRHEQPVRRHDFAFELPKAAALIVRTADESLLRYNEIAMQEIKRCSCCVLPETFPFIEFDERGVCNYCRKYKPKYRGMDPVLAKRNFIESLQKYRSGNGTPDVLVPFSGGRDSCYGLHLIKHEFGLNPITFTYDWGMVTDLARRNTARLCGKMGVQNILVSADIKKKRDNIRKNVSAWLKKPNLGMIPLFMAGDKHFFKIVNQLKQQTGIRLDLWSANPLENTDFKSGLCGVSPDFGKSRVDYLSWNRKFHLLAYYMACFVENPSYINASLLDTAQAFLSYYIEPRRDFFFMFSHMEWNEDEVNKVIIGDYDFELSPDSPSSWRIGDGTAPFYNYIYMLANGFTEFDTFRSNQIREGHITREKAMEAILVENRPRALSLRWYLDTVGLDFDSVIKRVNQLDVRGLHS
jgi:glucosamine--fructose-6-phosphate aminotransferase (isomerizing)